MYRVTLRRTVREFYIVEADNEEHAGAMVLNDPFLEPTAAQVISFEDTIEEVEEIG